MTHPLDRLDDALTDAQRAAVLVAAPVDQLLRWRDTLADSCRRANFSAGIAYLDAVADAMGMPRHRGALGTMRLDGATTTLNAIAEGFWP